MAAAKNKKNSGKKQAPSSAKPVLKPVPVIVMVDDFSLGKLKVSARPVFYASLVLMGLFLLMGALRMGVPADTPIDYSYGKACLNYFSSFGRDTTYAALEVDKARFPDQKYYGAAFEMITPALNSVLKPSNPFIIHHLLCALAGITLLLFTGLIAQQLKGWSAGLLALWIIFLTPVVSGNAFFNSKDIPFAAAFAAGFYYLVLFLERLPHISRSAVFGLGASVAAAVSIRISGILLPAYLVFFGLIWYKFNTDRKKSTDLFKKCFVPLITTLTAGTLLALLTYPNFWNQGMQHVWGGLAATKKFQHHIFMLYDDQIVSSQKVNTAGYLTNYLLMTVPEFVITGFLISIGLLIVHRNRFKKVFNWMLLFAAFFPFVYVMVVNAPVYNGWRHVMFAYPFVVIIMAIGVTEAFLLIRTQSLRYVLAGVIVIALVDLMVWQVRAFPYNYAYFNHISGGLPGVYKHYDTDYQQLATHEGVKWLLANEPAAGKKITVLSNNANALQYEYDSAAVKFNYVSVRDMWATDWDYAVLSTMFLNEKGIEAMFPPYGTIHTVDRFNVPLSFIVKRQSREELIVYRMMKADSLRAARDIIDQIFQTNKTNIMAWYWKACLFYLQGDYDASMQLLNKYEQIFPGQDFICELMGYNYYSQGRYNEALPYLNVVYKIRPQMRTYNKMIGDCLVKLGHADQAKFYYDKLK